jgi:tetratricopeptide (TPR) repeat protein
MQKHCCCWIRPIWWLPMLLALASCAGQQDASQIRRAESAYLQGLEAEQSGDYAGARELYRQAAERGGLQVDEYVECQIRLALCEARLESYDDAHQALDAVVEGASDLARLHVARAFVFRRQGKNGQAETEERHARSLDPRIELIKE